MFCSFAVNVVLVVALEEPMINTSIVLDLSTFRSPTPAEQRRQQLHRIQNFFDKMVKDLMKIMGLRTELESNDTIERSRIT